MDAFTGYRRYDRSQLHRARLIAWLRGIGMPLTRIRVVCDLPAVAAAQEVATYWRQVEADVAARRETVAFLLDRLSREETDMRVDHRPVRLDHAAALDRGLVRARNQDACHAGGALFAVADGFGLPDDPAEPGTSAAEAALDALRRASSAVPAPQLAAALTTAVHAARAAVREYATASSADGIGTTLTALLWSGADLALAHLGDSRAYLLRDGELTRMTQDHTYVQSLVDDGRLTPEEAAHHPDRTRLLRALVDDDTAEPDLHLRRAEPGDRYLLCTDGLHAVVPDLRIALTGTPPRDAVERLLADARAAGAPDNLACVVVDVHNAED